MSDIGNKFNAFDHVILSVTIYAHTVMPNPKTKVEFGYITMVCKKGSHIMYHINSTDGKFLGRFYEHQLELDTQYYREKRLNKLLDGKNN